jgi:maltose-binding protein MalE
LATLLIQNDNSIVKKELEKGSSANTYITSYISALEDNSKNYILSPAESILQFFLEFSNVSKKAYSWNKSISSSLDMFVEGKMAFYIGRASELFQIEKMNPNLSFDVSKMLQVKGATVEKTFGEIYALVINKKSTNLTTAFKVIGLLTNEDNAKDVSSALSLPPVLKSLLAKKPVENAYLHTFFDSALISRTWLDVDKKQTNLIFQDMVENTLSNSMSPSQAVSKASDQLSVLLK